MLKTNTKTLFFRLIVIPFLPLLSNLVNATEQPKFKVKSYDWNGVLPVNRTVMVKNNYGSIRSRSNSEDKVFLHASYQEIGENSLSPQFSVMEIDGVLHIEVLYSESIKDKKGSLRGRTDLSVLFPPNIKIIAESKGGLIKIDKSGSDVEAITETGDIKLTTTGLIKAHSQTGKIALRLRGMKEEGVSEISSTSGQIKIDVFDDMDIKMIAKTKGSIINNGKVSGLSKYTYSYGRGLSVVEVNSLNGDVAINIIKPPELVKSVKPSKKSVDLRNLPKSKPWKPGDPVKEVNPKRKNGKDKH